MNRKIASTIIAAFIFLSGCSNKSNVDKLTVDVNHLMEKTEQLSNDFNKMNAEFKKMKENVASTNKKVDTQLKALAQQHHKK
ncbi:hypothetical protein [Candidatus Tachikawaea gelatinosa]|uniref:Murein lipoprotein n=1 Tax=Candidatus Tachikawaea gelatinosa TaxID=1410383 RepID=A0A090AQQ0_9ENTR|nr:hypothetical protein [Candidatus Tachikawaea gelatinosa]BAP58672.1 murein lipoprotein [Candidatus Tachikawaea gelatinosa]